MHVALGAELDDMSLHCLFQCCGENYTMRVCVFFIQLTLPHSFFRCACAAVNAKLGVTCYMCG